MNMKHIDKMDKINYHVAFVFVMCSMIYTALTTEHAITYTDYTFAPTMVLLPLCVTTYVFLTIVKSNNIFEYVLGICMIIILLAFIPIVGYTFDPMATTAQYYKIISGIVVVGIPYISAFKFVKYAACVGMGDVKRGI